MARYIAAGNADVDDLPVAYTRGHNQPIGWKAEARCAGVEKVVCDKDGGEPSPWLVEAHKTYRLGNQRVKGAELLEHAAQLCSLCAVQWDCTAFAVVVGEPFGVWGLPHDDLEWLMGQADAQGIIREARAAGQPVQFAVRDLRDPARTC